MQPCELECLMIDVVTSINEDNSENVHCQYQYNNNNKKYCKIKY